MLSALGIAKPTLKLTASQTVVFLHPPKEWDHLNDNAPPVMDPLLWGNVAISLPKPKEIKHLVVKLVAYYTVALPGQPAESGILNEIKVNLAAGETLDKGVHTFAWSLTIPRRTAPYERNAFGRVYHRLYAVARGAGLGGSDLKDEIEMEVVVNPAEEGETTGLNERIEGFNEETGPYLMTLSSQHVTVGGVAHFAMNLPCVPADLNVHSVRAIVHQSFTLTSHAKASMKATPPAQRRLFFKLDHHTATRRAGTPTGADHALGSCSCHPCTVVNASARGGLLAFVPAGEALEISHVARFPDDDALRATTQHGTETPIRVKHELFLEMLFSGVDGKQKILRASRPLTISSCCCMLESLLLPSYSEVDAPTPLPASRRPRSPGCSGAVTCVCGLTLERLLTADGDAVRKAHAAAANRHESPTQESGFVLPKYNSSPAAV